MTVMTRRNFLFLASSGVLALGCPFPAAARMENPGEPDSLDPEQARLLAWLKGASPADWHRCACTWNWDQPFDAIRWIIRQPQCDAGTAVTLFARGEPSYYAQFADMAELEAKAGFMIETVRFLIEICERWQAGQYSAWRFMPDQLPELDPGPMPWPVPASLARAGAKGEKLDLTGWGEGFPPRFPRG